MCTTPRSKRIGCQLREHRNSQNFAVASLVDLVIAAVAVVTSTEQVSLSPSLSRSRSLSMDSRWLLEVGWGTLARSHKTALPTFFYAWILIARLRILSMALLTWKNFRKYSTDFSSEFSCKLFFKERLSDYVFIDFEIFFVNSANFSPEFSCKLFKTFHMRFWHEKSGEFSGEISLEKSAEIFQ